MHGFPSMDSSEGQGNAEAWGSRHQLNSHKPHAASQRKFGKREYSISYWKRKPTKTAWIEPVKCSCALIYCRFVYSESVLSKRGPLARADMREAAGGWSLKPMHTICQSGCMSFRMTNFQDAPAGAAGIRGARLARQRFRCLPERAGCA